jgi:uncharacterized protein YbjT (DUF2867 family)
VKEGRMILVTGSTGNVGSEVVKQLASGEHKVRALVRDRSSAAGKFPTTVDLAIGDLDSVDSLVAAMRGVDKVYLLAPMTPSHVVHEANAIAAAKRAQVKHVVKHSLLGAQYEAITLARWHRNGEKVLEASGLAWTHVRPSAFFTNALGWAAMIKNGGVVYQPTGEGKLGMVDPRDVAAVAVAALTEPGHESKAYDVTGGRALSTREQVEIIAQATGKPIKYVHVPDHTARDSMLRTMQPQLVELLLEYMGMVRGGQAAVVTDAVQKVTHRQPRTFEAWVQDHVGVFK